MASLLTQPVISRLPFGLLDFLGIKSGGRYPEQLLPTLQPMWDLQPFQTIWDERSAFDVSTTLAPAGLNFIPYNIVVPQTEMWLVHQITGFCQTDAGETLFASLAYADSYSFINIMSSVVLAASQQRHVSTAGLDPFCVGPGSIFGWMVDQITTAANIVAQIQVRYTRFRI
jgi:hypothetical protein